MGEFLIFLISLLVVILGAEWFLQASVSLARILRLPQMVIGATLISLATTMPENLVSVFASALAHRGLALGNVVGSGLVNLGLILGITFLVGQRQEEIHGGRGRRRSLILFSLVLFIFIWLLLFRQINLGGGLFLISLGGVYFLYTFAYALKEKGEGAGVVEEKLERHPRLVIKFILGALLLLIGARFLVENGIGLAKILGVPEIIIGITLVAVGTSLPELITALTALTLGHERVTLGNLTGATILLLTFTLGLAAVFGGIKVDLKNLTLDFFPLIFFTVLVMLTSWRIGFFAKISQRVTGLILISGYFLYLVFLLGGSRGSG